MSQVNQEQESEIDSSKDCIKTEAAAAMEVVEVLSDQQENRQQPLKMKNIRKDVFHYLKAVMEESRIFLPMKLPDEPEILPQPTPQMPEVVHVEVPEVI